MIIVFDTETTGLTLHPDAPVHKQPRIIEFGAALLDKGVVVETANCLIHPGEQITAEITKITGITDEDVKGAMNFVGVLPQIKRLFRQAHTVMAHNLPFDRAMLHNELIRADCVKFPWPKNECCTVGLYRSEWGYNPNLKKLYEHVMGVPLAQTHRALDDVMALVDIIKKEELWTLYPN